MTRRFSCRCALVLFVSVFYFSQLPTVSTGCYFLVSSCLICVPPASVCYDSANCKTVFQDQFPKCPGRYCGRPFSNGEVISTECQACPRGYRTDHYACIPCTEPLSNYSIMYLSFMVLVVLLCHGIFIDSTVRKPMSLRILLASATGETVAAILFAVLAYEPVGSLQLYSCGTERLSDWYTIFHNPPNMYCSSEAVYPLWTMIMMFYALGVALTLLVRLPVSQRLCHRDGRDSVYFALYLLPGLALVHVVLGGLIYYAFPYMILVASVTLDIIFFVYYKRRLFMKPRLVVHLVGRYVLSVYAIICLLVFFESSWAFVVLAIVLPALPTILFVAIHKLLDRIL